MYTPDKMKRVLTSHGVPSEAIKIDGLYSMLINRPALDLIHFDKWLHQKYGNYEDDGLTMDDLFKKIFEDDAAMVKEFFGD